MLGRVLGSVFRRNPPGGATPSASLADRLSAIARSVEDVQLADAPDERWSGASAEQLREVEERIAAECLDMLVRHGDAYEQAWALLADPASRELYAQLLAYRKLGRRRVRLPVKADDIDKARASARALAAGASAFAGLQRFHVPAPDGAMVMDCWAANVAWTFFIRQYWFDRGGVTIAPAPGDCVIDAGACFGDTALAFADATGKAGKVYAFEMEPGNGAVTRHNLSLNPGLAGRIVLEPCALGLESGTLYLHGSGPGALVSAQPGGMPVPVASLDDCAARHPGEKIDFIKMDIEGAEMDALKGARRLLVRDRPKLAISVYHHVADMARIPLWLGELDLGYRFYLDHYTTHHEETVLYAACPAR